MKESCFKLILYISDVLLFYSAGDIVLTGTLNFPLDSVYLNDYWISWGDGKKILLTILEGVIPFCGATDTLVLDFW